MSDNWRHIGSAESAFGKVLPPFKELVENTRTGEKRTVWVNVGETVGEAISRGNWADSAASREPDDRQAKRSRYATQEPKKTREPRKEKSGNRRITGLGSGGRGGGDDNTVLGGLGLLLVGALCVGLTFGAGWVMEHSTHFSLVWWLSVVVFLATALFTLQIMLGLLVVVGVLWAIVALVAYFIEHPW